MAELLTTDHTFGCKFVFTYVIFTISNLQQYNKDNSISSKT